MFSLDSSLRALDPSEVSTVIFCDRQNEQQIRKSAEFDFGPDTIAWFEWKTGARQFTVLTVYDFDSRRFLGAHLLAGPHPPPGAREWESGGEPDVGAFVAKMPLE